MQNHQVPLPQLPEVHFKVMRSLKNVFFRLGCRQIIFFCNEKVCCVSIRAILGIRNDCICSKLLRKKESHK